MIHLLPKKKKISFKKTPKAIKTKYLTFFSVIKNFIDVQDNFLEVKNQPLVYFPRTLLYLENLTNLTLSNAELTYIPDDIDKLSSVKILDLSNNQIRSVPDSMAALAYTAYKIDLRGNLLCREVPGQDTMEPVLPLDMVEELSKPDGSRD